MGKIEKKQSKELLGGGIILPPELKPIEKAVGPAIKVGKKTGNFMSDVIDFIVDMFN